MTAAPRRSAEVEAYLAVVDAKPRALFDRVERLIVELHPEVEVVLSYKMPTYRIAGGGAVHVGVWKHGVSLYGWDADRDGGFVARHPELSSGRGTLRLPVRGADGITDDELRAVLRGALDPAT